MVNFTIKSAQSRIDLCWHLFLVLAAGFTASLLPDFALAQAASNNAVEEGMCNIVGQLTGATGKAIATIAIIAVGIGALLGKISWSMALIVGLGIMLVFGAATIVNAVQGGSISCSGGTIGGS